MAQATLWPGMQVSALGWFPRDPGRTWAGASSSWFSCLRGGRHWGVILFSVHRFLQQFYSSPVWRGINRRPDFVALMLVAGGCLAWPCRAEERAGAPAERIVAAGVLTSFDQMWQLAEAEQHQWHRVRLDYVVFYYDPLWKAMWGQAGGVESYLSLGSEVFPIKPGSRILVEGLMLPARGMSVEEPMVTVLAEAVPLEALPTTGRIGDMDRFNKRLVMVEGTVDRQTVRDANHLEIDLLVEGRLINAQVLLRGDEPVPQLREASVRMQGVYFARGAAEGEVPRIELWVQRKEDVTVLGWLARDPRFDRPQTPGNRFAQLPPGELVRVLGTVQQQQPGKSLTIQDETGPVRIQTLQTRILLPGEAVEAIGFPGQEGRDSILRQGVFRSAQTIIASMEQLGQLPDAEKRNRYRVRLDCVVHYFDPSWKVLWGRSGGLGCFFSLGPVAVSPKPGQRVRIEGSLVPADGMRVEEPRVTVLAEGEPLELLSTAGRVADFERFHQHRVSMEGLVDRLRSIDGEHRQIDLVTEGRAVIVRLQCRSSTTVPALEGALVRVIGTYVATPAPAGGIPTIELWVQDQADVEVRESLDRDPRFKVTATPIEKLATLPPGAPARVAGVVRAQQPGKSITLRDETGQVTLPTAQTLVAHLGERIEAIGFPERSRDGWTLRESLYRRTAEMATASATGLMKLRLAEQLRELQAEEASRSYPVELTGVVTWAQRDADFFFVRDASGGACVLRPVGRTEPIQVGAKVEVTGVSAAGRFTPEVLAGSVRVFSTVDLPEAKTVMLEQALTGIEEAQWVSMSGFVREVGSEGPWTRLELTTAAGDFDALVPPDDRLAKLRGAVVRVRGVCAARTNNKRQLTGILLWVPTAEFLEVEEALPDDPFRVEARSIGSLRQFSSQLAFNRRVRVSGVVLHQIPGRLVRIQEGSDALTVLNRDPAVRFVPGDRVEAVGLPGREGSRLTLREAVLRRTAAGPQPVPLSVVRLDAIDAENDGLLARVEGTLLDADPLDQGARVYLQVEGGICAGLLDRLAGEMPAQWERGSRVALTGVFVVQFDEDRRPRAAQLQLRSERDLQILRRPPWWTARRLISVTGILLVGLVLGFTWVFVLRRRVQQQTGQITEQQETEKAVRLEAALLRASKLESLGVLAGGIAHDFNNLLTVVMGNLSLAKLDARCEPETMQCLVESERAAIRARDLTQQLLTFAKGGAPIREATVLADIARETAEFVLHGAKVSCEFDLAPDLWPADVDKGQIGQVVQNLVLNAKDAMAAGGVVRLVLRNDEIAGEGRSGLAPGRYLKLSVSDTGSGIAPEIVSRIFEPYFTTKRHGSGLGLATVYSIVKKHQGHIEVESTVGQGTTLHVWLPAAERPPEPVATEAGPLRAQTGRVLFMDDEAQIRDMAITLLQRMGLEVTAVDDGSAVVIEYVAAREAGRSYDLVMLDLTVPGGMGGAKAMEKLRQIDPQVRAIVSSGYSSDPVLANHRAHGFSGIVPKPYVVGEMAEVIDRVLRERRS